MQLRQELLKTLLTRRCRGTVIEVRSETKTQGPSPSLVWVFLVLVFGLSWPFLICGFGWFTGDEHILNRYLLSCSGMLMVAFSAFIVRSLIEHEGFKDVGWNIGHFKWYVATLLSCLLFWAVPSLVDLLLGNMAWNHDISRNEIIVVILSLAGFSLLAGFGEEFGWRGYLLPRLLSDPYTARGVLLLIGIIWGIWHFPVALGPLLRTAVEGSTSWVSLTGPTLLSCLQMIGASIGLSFIFGAVWLKSRSIFLTSFLHGYFIGIRDATWNLLGNGATVSLVIRLVLIVAIAVVAYRWLMKYERSTPRS